ncbi:MAG TPA: thiamine pyrophosphate-binding protein [Desulfovibrio sp.]|uniref:thiamine pyrophosphate-binding protein n=1 Tax=Desulfovibrio sp. TaxID=885 RepID=UPI002D3084C2|nr:thiamine pyrophosphate-binding protein [Desulfovibrio sp.]HZF62226.1 thiamine pyrophosphate-binding protein [Desulfovibrio sp.]
MKISVAEYVAKFIISKGVRHFFGYQGSAALKLIDAMCTEGMTYCQSYHEQAAAFAADGYARISGNIGVAVATSGPGATNLLTGIADAYFDSVPCIFITGQVDCKYLIRDKRIRQSGFQQVDIVSIAQPIVKYAVTVMDPEDIYFELDKAWNIATSGRKGPVLIDIPLDIQFANIENKQIENAAPIATMAAIPDVEDVLNVLANSNRPLILCGGGVRQANACGLASSIIAATGIPAISTLCGLDATSDIISFSGIFGRSDANLLLDNADTILVLGSRLSVHQLGKQVKSFPRGKLIQIDIDPDGLYKNTLQMQTIRADLYDFLSQMVALQLSRSVVSPDRFSCWRAQANIWTQRYADNVLVNGAGANGIDPVLFCRQIYRMMPEDTIYCADVGQNQMWAAQAYIAGGSRRLLNSAGHGSMGFALPAAIGASYAAPSRTVVAFIGDGGFQMNLQELQFIHDKNMPILCIVFNNNTLGMMRAQQKKYFSEHYIGSSTEYYSCVNLKKIADAYGIKYFHVTEHSHVEMLQSFIGKTPCLIEVSLHADAKLLNRYDEPEIFSQNSICNQVHFEKAVRC